MSEIEIDRSPDNWSKEAKEAFAEFQARTLLENVSIICVVAIDLNKKNAVSIHFGKASSAQVSVEMCQDIALMFELTAKRLKQ